MPRDVFDAETALDVAVNLIPLAIICFFVVLFAAVNPWGFDPLQTSIQFSILLGMIVALAVVTYYAATFIEREAERGR